MADTIKALREALQGMLNITSDSRGVAGYHLNGAVAEWDEFPEVDAARAALAAQEQAVDKVERNREADRACFPDPNFNRWLDEAVTENGEFTVWDQIGDTCDAWSGWTNRPFYPSKEQAEPVAEVVWHDPTTNALPERPGKIIDASLAFFDSAPIGTKLYLHPPTPQPVAQQDRLDALDKRRIFDAIRGAYDLGYSDARNAKTIPGDNAPGYAGRDCESDHGGALIRSLDARRMAPQPVAVPADEPSCLDAIRRALDGKGRFKPTPGEWVADDHRGWVHPMTEVRTAEDRDNGGHSIVRVRADFSCTVGKSEYEWANAAFVSACSPKNIREVLAYIESLAAAPTAPAREPLTDERLQVMRQENGGALNFVSLREFKVVARAVERECASRWGVTLGGIGQEGGAA